MNSIHILVVDDDPVCTRLLRLALTPQGFLVRNVGDAVTALDLARCTHPDLMLVDFRLPDADGLQLARWLRAEPSLQGLPIVLWSAYPLHGDPEIRASGCNGFIAKPFDTRSIGASLRRHLPAGARSSRRLEPLLSGP